MKAPPVHLCDYLDDSASRWPERVAVVDPSGRTLTYRELDDCAGRIAGFLASSGVQPGDRVGVIAPKSADVVATLFGIMRAGAAYVPADYTAPPSRNRTLLSDCAVRLVFLDPGCRDIVSEWPTAETPDIVWLGAGDDTIMTRREHLWSRVIGHAPIEERPRAGVDGLAYILYTSGSTGIPKGVTLTHENATSFVDWCSDEFQPNERDRFSSHAPFHFDLSILDIYVPLKHGAELHLVSESVGKNPQELAAFIGSRRLTVWYSTPSTLSLLPQFGQLDRHDCSSLRLVLFAGEVFPVKHLRSIVARWPHATFYNLYGPTETNVCTFARIPPMVPDDRTEPYPIGFACPHCEELVLDGVDGREVTPGEEGLLYIAGPSLFQGYWNHPAAELFSHRNGRRWYNTGDVVRWTDDGYVYLGRRDRMVKRRGYRIELGEIERGLYQNERIREAAAVAIPDASAGVRILAYLTAQAGPRPSIVELKTFCGRALPAYMNPDAFIFVDALPRTSTNKVDYQALMRMQSAPAQPA